jgi:hypothetical protein
VALPAFCVDDGGCVDQSAEPVDAVVLPRGYWNLDPVQSSLFVISANIVS